MTRLILIFILLMPFSLLLAQNASVSYKPAAEWFGETQRSENAKVFKAVEKIVGFDVDTTNQILYLILQEEKNGKLKSKGVLVSYSLMDDKVNWEIEMNYTYDQFLLHDTMPLISNRSSTNMLDRKSGKVLWNSSTPIEFGVPGKAIGIGTSRGTAKAIIGVNLYSGSNVWKYMNNGIYDLESVTLLGDSGMVISSKGIHYTNFETGRGFSHKARLDYATSSHTPVMMGGMMGGALGAIFAQAMFLAFESPIKKIVGNQKSNVAIHKECIFYTDLRGITALNMDGKIIWRKDLPRNLKPLSKIFVHHDNIILINNGILKFTDGDIFGPIYLSKWDSETGELLAENYPGKIKGEYINDFYIRDETIVLALSNRMAEYNLDTFELISEKSFGDPTISSGLGNIVNPPYYLMTEDKIDNRSYTNPKEIYIENSNGMKIAFSPELEITAVVRKPNFYSFSQYAGPWMILENGTDAIVINEKSEILNQTPFSNNLEFINGYFYDFQDDKFIIASENLIIE